MTKESCSSRLRQALELRNIKQADLSQITKIPKSAISQYLSGKFEPKQDRLEILAKALDVSEAWLMGYNVNFPCEYNDLNLPPPTITEDYTTFPVIGEVAAGYEHIAMEDWEGDTVDISNNYLKGRNKKEFFVLRVKGDSMYPEYQDGDKVLVLKQSTLNYSGQVGVVMYDNEFGTLKKVEYKQGEDWMRLVAINPAYPPKLIENEDLELCNVLGIPKLLIRDIKE